MVINNQIKDKIKYLGCFSKEQRRLRGLSQTQLADLSDTSINFIVQVEKGKTTVRINKLLQVLNVLGIQLNANFGNSMLFFPEAIKKTSSRK